MKRLLALILGVICTIAFVACNPTEGDGAVQNHYFTGEVIEKYEGSYLVEVTDIGNGPLAVGDRVVVKTDIPDSPQYETGDFLKIVFDGKIAKSYPQQITNPSTIIKIDSGV